MDDHILIPLFWFVGISSQGKGFGLQMAQAGFSSHLVNVSGSS